MREWQEKYGLTCSGTHTHWPELLPENLEATIAYHKILGNKHIIMPGADLSSLDKIIDICAIMNKAQLRLAQEGIALGFHNHGHDFLVRPWGSTVHSELEKRGTFDFELDTYWVFQAGVDPIATMERLASRIQVIHLRDGLRDEDGTGRTLGQGEAPVALIREKAIAMGFRMVVETVGLNPTGLEEARQSLEYLRSLE